MLEYNCLKHRRPALQEFDSGGAPDRRPFLSSECDNLGEAEKWRLDVIREITKNIGEIQNAGLGEHRIRDLNDHINKLLREKFHWQKRLKELGGSDYNANEPKSFDADGRELPGGGGYKYFGAAKELPGVRELFQAEAIQAPRRTRALMYKNVTPDYYGYRDEDDGTLADAEAAQEKRMVDADVRAWEEAKRQRKSDAMPGAEEATESSSSEEESGAFGAAHSEASAANSAALRSHVAVPSQEAVGQAILAYRKEQLAKQFLGE
jgi:pre-mRNA-splicing factor ISY1